jgi:hypothetical protein
MLALEIFITDDCWSCEESRRIAEETQARFEDIEVVLTNLGSEARPANVFAAPTYMLNGELLSLGNPRRVELWDQLSAKIAALNSDERII